MSCLRPAVPCNRLRLWQTLWHNQWRLIGDVVWRPDDIHERLFNRTSVKSGSFPGLIAKHFRHGHDICYLSAPRRQPLSAVCLQCVRSIKGESCAALLSTLFTLPFSRVSFSWRRSWWRRLSKSIDANCWGRQPEMQSINPAIRPDCSAPLLLFFPFIFTRHGCRVAKWTCLAASSCQR